VGIKQTEQEAFFILLIQVIKKTYDLICFSAKAEFCLTHGQA
jgi:hypothetical protein